MMNGPGSALSNMHKGSLDASDSPGMMILGRDGKQSVTKLQLLTPPATSIKWHRATNGTLDLITYTGADHLYKQVIWVL